jgi:alkylhydroperoxidase/carboxymuconolactone decarboxylase family protein YurZ
MTSPIEQIKAGYLNSLGFVPDRIQNRLVLGMETAPEMTLAVEEARGKLLEPEALDHKTCQLMAFGMLLMNLSQAAENHAVAALRVGATTAELQAVAGIAFVFRGIPAVNLAGDAISGALKKLEQLK